MPTAEPLVKVRGALGIDLHYEGGQRRLNCWELQVGTAFGIVVYI